MYTCAVCGVQACRKMVGRTLPQNCPMRDSELIESAMAEYEKTDIRKFYIGASEIEGLGRFEWTRVKETMMLCRRMGYHKIGLAFCGGLKKEAEILVKILARNGFEVVSVMCKAGGADKSCVGIDVSCKVHGDAFEAMCNPVLQAKALNSQNTEFNIVLGLCVGHDSLFYQYSEALVTTLVVKDRVLAHNPVAALYQADQYYKNKLNL